MITDSINTTKSHTETKVVRYRCVDRSSFTGILGALPDRFNCRPIRMVHISAMLLRNVGQIAVLGSLARSRVQLHGEESEPKSSETLKRSGHIYLAVLNTVTNNIPWSVLVGERAWIRSDGNHGMLNSWVASDM